MTKELLIIGTSHIAKQSVEKVEKTITENRPQAVGVELDMMRYRGLIAKETKKAKGAGFYNIPKVGIKGFIFAMIGSFTMKKLAKYVGTNPGADMLHAVQTANKEGIRAYLIDQNINTTLSRFSKALTAREIFRFLADIIKGIFNPKGELKKLGIKKFDLNSVPSDEIVEKMIDHMKKRYPSLYKVLVQERNIHMARKIMKIMQLEEVEKMVAVVGAGHQKGIKELLEQQAKANFSINTV